jgi:hypothetical protein
MADTLTALGSEDDPRHFQLARRAFLRASAAAGATGLVAPFSQIVGAAEPSPGESIFELGDLLLQSGETPRSG